MSRYERIAQLEHVLNLRDVRRRARGRVLASLTVLLAVVATVALRS